MSYGLMEVMAAMGKDKISIIGKQMMLLSFIQICRNVTYFNYLIDNLGVKYISLEQSCCLSAVMRDWCYDGERERESTKKNKSVDMKKL